MYCPAAFEEQRAEVLLRLIAEHPLATVIRNHEGELLADHVPLLHVPTPDGAGQLIGHVAKGNDLWRVSASDELLLVFQGPQSYISPNWYATKQDEGKVVPTWNYAVVHVHARLTAIHAPQAVRDILISLTRTHEGPQPHPWQLDDAPEAFTNRLIDNIVGLRLDVLRMQGKWKVSQNQPSVNRASAISALKDLGSPGAVAMSALIPRP